MKKFIKVLGVVTLLFVTVLYLAFLFYLPKAIDLNMFLPEVKKIVKEQADIELEIKNPQIITTPTLGLGVKTDDINVKFLDGSDFLSTKGVEARLSLPSLLLLTVKVPEVEVFSPVVNLDIDNGEQFKIVRLVENIINKQKNSIEKVPVKTEPSWIVSKIKILVPNVKIVDYKVVVDDKKSGHSLTLCGNDFSLAYLNGKVLKLKTDATVFSDENKNIVANIDLNTFIPPAQPKDDEDDEVQRVEFPFVNPVLMYRDYDLKSNIDAKIKLRQKDDVLKIKGFLNIEDLTMNLSGYQLPECYARFKFNGTSIYTDTNFFVTKNQHLSLLGKLNYGKHPAMDMSISSQKIYFNDVLILTRALLDTLHIKHELADISGQGYVVADTKIKSNFKKLKSNGSIVVRDGALLNNKIGLLISGINADLLFDNNALNIQETQALINGAKLSIEGSIEQNSNLDIKVFSDEIPLRELFIAFAPADIKSQFALNSGVLKLNAVVQGKIKKIIAAIDFALSDIDFREKNNNIVLSNNKFTGEFKLEPQTVFGKIQNTDLVIEARQPQARVRIPNVVIDIDKENIILNPLNILLNKNSVISVDGEVLSYSHSPKIKLFADGKFNTLDLQQIVGNETKPFISSSGVIPMKLLVNGTNKKQTVTIQLFADANNYFTPVHIKPVFNRQSIIQGKMDYKGDRVRIYDTGLYVKNAPVEPTDDLLVNMDGVKDITRISGTITALNTPEPFINLFKIMIPTRFDVNLAAFKGSQMTVDGGLFVFGKAKSPRMRGHFRVSNARIDELFIKLEEAYFDFVGKYLDIIVRKLDLNGSDINVTSRLSLQPASLIHLYNVNVNSQLINVDKILKIVDVAATKFAAPSNVKNTAPTPVDIPIVIHSGRIDLRRIVVTPLELLNTSSAISMNENKFYLHNLRTRTFDGNIRGNIIVNLVNNGLVIKLSGNGLNVEEVLLKLANLKDTLTGVASFKTDISLSGITFEEQMKTLKGDVDFTLKEGQLGPFGKIENLILAENIRESEFFQTTIGQIVNSLTSIDTSHYDVLQGKLSFEDGVTYIESITSLGNVLSVQIFGNMDLLANQIDVKLRGRLASQVSDMLGPLAYLNPINLIKNTPGMNVFAAKAFALFCESISQEEMAKIPQFVKHSDEMATKFQVVIRGDVAKPLTLIKSFKWLAEQSQIDNASTFVSTLPEPKKNAVKDYSVINVEEEKSEKKFLFFNKKK